MATPPFRQFSGQNAHPLFRAILSLSQAVRNCPATTPISPRALLVGGGVRDLLLDKTPTDMDVEIFGIPADDLQALVERLFPGKTNLVGQSFGILKVHLEEGHGLDIGLPRRETKLKQGHRGFFIDSDPTLSLEEAAQRRDFTINAIYADPLTEEIIDPFHGQLDLRERRLRLVDPTHFAEDPLRVYRALQFRARFALEVEPETFRIMKTMVESGALKELTRERITEEIKKLLLKAERPSLGFSLARELGIIQYYYPELEALKSTPQEPEWHPEGDVWIHTLMVIDEAAKIIRQSERELNEDECLQVMLGALCHDLGKPATTKLGEKEGIPRIRSIGHEEAGAEPTKNLFRKWSFSQETEHAAVMQAVEHLKPGTLYRSWQKGELTDEQYGNAIRKLLKRISPASWKVLLAAAEADYRGRALPQAKTEPFEIGRKFIDVMKQQSLTAPLLQPLIYGRDLFAIASELKLSLQPGPQIGEILQRVELARDEGTIRTRKEALTLARELLLAMTGS